MPSRFHWTAMARSGEIPPRRLISFLCHVDEESGDALVADCRGQRDCGAEKATHQRPLGFRPWAADDAITHTALRCRHDQIMHMMGNAASVCYGKGTSRWE